MSAANHRSSARRAILLGLVLAAFALRVVGLDRQSLWRDEVDAIYFAVRDLDATLSMFVQAAQNGPLYFLALRPWFALMGTWEFVLRFPSAAAGTLSIPLLWHVGRRLLPQRSGGSFVALTAAALMTFNPYQVWYGQEGKMYATITCLALLASYLWLRGMEEGGPWPWVGYLITVSAAMYIHLLMVLLIPVHFVWFWLAWPQTRRRWRPYALALAGLTLPYLPMVWWHWWLLTSPDKLSGFNFTPLDKMAQGLLLNQARGFITTIETVWLAPIFFTGAAGLLLGAREIAAQRSEGQARTPALHQARTPSSKGAQVSSPAFSPASWQRIALLLTWLLLPVALIYLLSLRQPVFTERYVIWIGPAAMLAVALGLQVILANSGRAGPFLVAGLLAYTLVLWGYANWQQKVLTIKYDLRSAVHYIQERRDPNDLLILQIPHQEWSFRYYSDDFAPNPFDGSDARLGHWVGGPYTNYGEPDAQARAGVDAQMQTATAGSKTVWVMLSEAEMWDARRLMDEWLAAHGSVVEQADFPGVGVRRYILEP